jgi:DNA-binding NarL/FixJ family response regulator
MPIKVLLADRSQLALLGLRTLLQGVERVQVVDEAQDNIALQAQLVRHRPDVVLIDHAADGFGPKAVREGLKRSRRTRFLAITHEPSAMALMSAIRAGVMGCVRKDCDLEEIVDAVVRPADGDRFFCGKVLESLRKAHVDVARFIHEPLSCAPVTLSERECEVIGLIAEGHSSTRIAEQLHLSAHTVATHRKNIMQKLGVNSTAAVVMYAVRNGLASPNRYLFNAGA